MFVRNFGKISIFLAFSGSFAVKNDNFAVFFVCFSLFWLQILSLPVVFPKQKYTAFMKTVRSERKNQSEHTDLPKTGFAI